MFAGLHGRGSKPRERGGVANNLTTFIRSQPAGGLGNGPMLYSFHGAGHGVSHLEMERRRKSLL
jgi:hypothetical protein